MWIYDQLSSFWMWITLYTLNSSYLTLEHTNSPSCNDYWVSVWFRLNLRTSIDYHWLWILNWHWSISTLFHSSHILCIASECHLHPKTTVVYSFLIIVYNYWMVQQDQSIPFYSIASYWDSLHWYWLPPLYFWICLLLLPISNHCIYSRFYPSYLEGISSYGWESH